MKVKCAPLIINPLKPKNKNNNIILDVVVALVVIFQFKNISASTENKTCGEMPSTVPGGHLIVLDVINAYLNLLFVSVNIKGGRIY